MVECDGQRAFAGGTRGGDVVARPDGGGAGARDASEDRNVEDADGDDAHHQAGAVDRRQHDGRQQRREGESEVGAAHDDFFDPAAPRRGQRAKCHAGAKTDADSDNADHDAVLRPHQQLARDVAAEAVGAEPVRASRRLQLGRDVDLGRRIRRPEQRQQRRSGQQQRQRSAEHKARVAQRACQRSAHWSTFAPKRCGIRLKAAPRLIGNLRARALRDSPWERPGGSSETFAPKRCGIRLGSGPAAHAAVSVAAVWPQARANAARTAAASSVRQRAATC